MPIRPRPNATCDVTPGLIDRIAHVAVPAGCFAGQGAVFASVGLCLATWIRRVGRAVAVSVAGYAFFAFGWLILLEMGVVTGALSWLAFSGRTIITPSNSSRQIAAIACPLGGQIFPFEISESVPDDSRTCELSGRNRRDPDDDI